MKTENIERNKSKLICMTEFYVIIAQKYKIK